MNNRKFTLPKIAPVMYSCHNIPRIPAVRNTTFERKIIVEKFSKLPDTLPSQTLA
jgi:hypothetical protein